MASICLKFVLLDTPALLAYDIAVEILDSKISYPVNTEFGNSLANFIIALPDPQPLYRDLDLPVFLEEVGAIDQSKDFHTLSH